MEETEDEEKMGFLAVIRGKSQRWVALSCDAHLVSSGQGRIRQPCVQSSYWDQTRANIFLMSTILRGKLLVYYNDVFEGVPRCGAPTHLVPCFLFEHAVLLVSSVRSWSKSLSFYWAGL